MPYFIAILEVGLGGRLDATNVITPLISVITNVSMDHEAHLGDTLKKVAKKHKLKAIFHEKPFDELNGSGKHLNWSLATPEGVNLLNPGDKPDESLLPHSKVLLAANARPQRIPSEK